MTKGRASTIAAISTPRGSGAIGIVRLSGPDAAQIVKRAFVPYGKTPLDKVRSHALTLGRLVDPADGTTVDECLCAVMRAPRTYTGEDVVELNCHGGAYLCERALDILLACGAEPAEPGEFTKRAFLNGRLDLTRAEAVADLIAARGAAAAANAAAQLAGGMQGRISALRGELVRLNADILVGVEYPDEDIETAEVGAVLNTLRNILDKINKLYSSFELGRAMTEGIGTAIVGRPNVGKSSLLNALAGCERAIVTPAAGTTRDVLEQTVRLRRALLNLSDTAGIREGGDDIEAEGIRRARAAAEGCELALCVFDGSEPLTAEDFEVVRLTGGKTRVAVINKRDLPSKIDKEYISREFKHTVYISALKNEGIDDLRAGIERALDLSDDDGGGVVTSRRQRKCLAEAAEHIACAVSSLEGGFGADIVTVDLDGAADALGRLTGESASQSVIDDIFSRFCLGK